MKLNSKIKAILFDADGVVITNKFNFSRQVERDYGIPLSKTIPFFEGDFKPCMTGAADLKEELAKHVKDWGWKGTIDELLDYWFKCEHNISEKLVETIQKIRAKGIKCYLATNQEKYRTTYLIEKMGFGNSFDGVFSSAHIGHKKPSEQYFTNIIDKLDLRPEEIMFWDDSKENVDAAKKLGFDARFYVGYEDFEKIIKGLL